MRRDLANARMGQFVGYLVGGRLLWHDEGDAWPAWADATSSPETVTAGRWESPDGAVAVVLVFHP